MVRRLALLLAVLLPLAAQSEPALLQIRILEGEGVAYPLGSRATRGLTVQVTDETGKPVEGATVNFRLPDDGPTGTFASGARTETVATDRDGRASVWGMQWNRQTGPFEVRVTAAKGQTLAGTVVTLYLTPALVAAEPPRGGLGRHRRLWISIGIAGGAFLGAAAIAGRSGPNQGTAAAVSAPAIGPPTIVIGRP